MSIYKNQRRRRFGKECLCGVLHDEQQNPETDHEHDCGITKIDEQEEWMKRVVPVLIVIILIFAVGGFFAWEMIGKKYQPEVETLDYKTELGLGENEYSITFNRELLTDEHAQNVDGRIYLRVGFVTQRINSRFYYDDEEELFLYTTPTEILTFTPDVQSYTIKSWDDSTEADEGYLVVRRIDGVPYVDASYVQEKTKMEYAAYTDPGRIVINTKWGEENVVKIKEDTPLRYRGGIKSEILRTAVKGEKMVMIDDSYEDWICVASDDGYIGWVSRKAAGNTTLTELQPPEFAEQEYPSIHRDFKINMLWHQVMTEVANEYVGDVIKASPGINVLSPTWFWFNNTDGEVVSIAGTGYVEACHAAGIEVWALFSNEFPEEDEVRYFDTEKTTMVLSATSRRSRIISQVIQYVLDNGIDGINIDFELIAEDAADDYIEFIRELSIPCRYYGIVLSVDNYVPAYTYYYNRREQGIVADYVVIMGYDETPGSSETPGPVASSAFVRQGITDTLELVDKSKVINGIPFYTRVWSTTPDGKVSSFACGMEEAAGYLENHKVTPVLDESSGLNYGSYTSTIDGNLYEIWLQDADAVNDEMSMILEYDLAGVAEWKSGFESGTEIWKIISAGLK